MENSILFTIIANNYVQLKLNSIMIYKLQNGGFGLNQEEDKKVSLFSPKKNELPKEVINEPPIKHAEFDPETKEIPGFSNIDQDIKEGASWLYPRGYRSKAETYWKNNAGQYFKYNKEANPTVNLEGYTQVPFKEISKLAPKRDYLGGDDYRIKAMRRMPELLNVVRQKSEAYGIDPNLMLHRLAHEGFIDERVREYNNSGAKEQKSYFEDFFKNPIEQYGYGDYGLDDAGAMLKNNTYSLKNDIEWDPVWYKNEQGRSTKSVRTQNVEDMLEIMAADLAYRKDQLAKRGYNDNWRVNAAYNMGLYNKNLADDALENRYSYPDYYSMFRKGGVIKQNIESVPIRKKVIKPISTAERLDYNLNMRYKQGGKLK